MESNKHGAALVTSDVNHKTMESNKHGAALVTSNDEESKVSMEQEQQQQQQPREEEEDDEWKKIRDKHLKKLKKFCYRDFFYIGVPMPLSIIVPTESADRTWVNPLLWNLLWNWSIDEHQHDIDEQCFRAFFMITVIMVVFTVLSMCNPSYASLGVWFWCNCICILCTLTYLFWLRYKKRLGDKYRVSIAKWALELRKELPDQCNEYLINKMSNKATESSLGFNHLWMWLAVSYGMIGICLCGNYYSGFRDVVGWMQSSCLGLILCGIYYQKRLFDNKLKVSMEQPPEDDNVSSDDDDDDDELEVSMDYGKQRHRLADLGVPMPPGMVLKKPNRFIIPILEELVVDERKIIVIYQEYLNRNAFIAFIMMPVIFVVIVVVSICNPSYASLGFGLWFYIIYCLCSVIYLCWLGKKELALEKIRVEIAELVLQERKKLPMVEVDNVEADQCADDLINKLCYKATIPLNISYCWIYSGVLVGILGIVFCGDYYWNAY